MRSQQLKNDPARYVATTSAVHEHGELQPQYLRREKDGEGLAGAKQIRVDFVFCWPANLSEVTGLSTQLPGIGRKHSGLKSHPSTEGTTYNAAINNRERISTAGKRHQTEEKKQVMTVTLNPKEKLSRTHLSYFSLVAVFTA